MLTYILEEY